MVLVARLFFIKTKLRKDNILMSTGQLRDSVDSDEEILALELDSRVSGCGFRILVNVKGGYALLSESIPRRDLRGG